MVEEEPVESHELSDNFSILDLRLIKLCLDALLNFLLARNGGVLRHNHQIFTYRPLNVVKCHTEVVGIETVMEEAHDYRRARLEEHLEIFHTVDKVTNLILFTHLAKFNHDLFQSTILIVHGAKEDRDKATVNGVLCNALSFEGPCG